MGTQTIQATGKLWKLLLIIGVLLLPLGGLFVIVGKAATGQGVGGVLVVGYVLLSLGLALIIGSKAGAWWYHG